tara:strand:+ start:62 stop:391 length:330 start_codon:yes stop_codon:yes gene_type:complete
MAQSYNGWSNYETWLVNLWADNEGLQEYWQDAAADIYQLAERENRPDDAVSDLADLMSEYYDAAAEEWMSSQSGMFADMINSSLREVHWYEIAKHYIDAIVSEIEAEEA